MVRKYFNVIELRSSPSAPMISRTCPEIASSKPTAGDECPPGEKDAKKLDEACRSEMERLLPIDDPGLLTCALVAFSLRMGGPDAPTS